MGKIRDKAEAWTEKTENAYRASKLAKSVNVVSETASDIYDVASNTVVLALSKAWLGIGVWRPANTDPTGKPSDRLGEVAWMKKKRAGKEVKSTPTDEYALRASQRLEDTGAYKDVKNRMRSGSGVESRKVEDYSRKGNYDKLWSMRFGGDSAQDDDGYYLPLSQTFTLQAKKRLNTSSLVDGIDVIQQTHKEAKTIDCTIRVALRESQKNLQIVDKDDRIVQLSDMLSDLYERDTVFFIANQTINDTFGVEYVIMSEYKFVPRPSMGTYTFEFSLTEVKYEDNVLTLDLNEVSSGSNQITG